MFPTELIIVPAIFLGLPWMHTRGSALLGWVGNDAEHVADHIAARTTSAIREAVAS